MNLISIGEFSRMSGLSGLTLLSCHERKLLVPARVEAETTDVRELPGGRCVSLVHHGPYSELSRSYGRVMEYAMGRGLVLSTPSREVYLKGPGMIFKGNPMNYLTELQFLIAW